MIWTHIPLYSIFLVSISQSQVTASFCVFLLFCLSLCLAVSSPLCAPCLVVSLPVSPSLWIAPLPAFSVPPPPCLSHSLSFQSSHIISYPSVFGHGAVATSLQLFTSFLKCLGLRSWEDSAGICPWWVREAMDCGGQSLLWIQAAPG